MLRELLGLFYPRICLACHAPLMRGEAHVCTQCILQLPLTHYHRQKDNPLEQKFWGRCAFERAYAYLYFRKEGMAQQLLHEIKYRGNKELAYVLGTWYGTVLKEMDSLPDAVVAVPLHKSKERRRGYNQSAWFAKGLAESMGIADYSMYVMRTYATQTQTRKSRFDRWLNVKEVFAVTAQEHLDGKHLLICDDVVTTGATIEGLVKALPSGCRISVCAIAVPLL